MATVIYGSELSMQIKEGFKEEIDKLKESGKRIPKLSVILVGNNPASVSYVKGKEKACAQIGMLSEIIRMDENSTTEQVVNEVEKLNADETVDGILVQLPMPKQIHEKTVLYAISPDKDVDGLHPVNVAKLYMKEDGFVPCTPQGVMEMLKKAEVNLKGKRVAVLGRSKLVGAPVAQLLVNANATVTICHSKTVDIADVCRESDVIVAAVGVAKMVKKDWVKPGAVIIDVGVNRLETGKLVGDVDFDEVKEVASVITPVPKGVGPMTITMLLKNTLKSYAVREKK